MDFFDSLVRYETQLWNAVDRALLTRGAVSVATLQALRIVQRYGGEVRVQDLSADLGITVGAASKVADRLERAGLAVRVPHPTDRRSTQIVLTTAGDAAVAAALPVANESLVRYTTGVDLADLTAGLHRLHSTLDAALGQEETR